jgi:hypothetical protein
MWVHAVLLTSIATASVGKGRERAVSADALQQVVSAYSKHWHQVTPRSQALAAPLLERMKAKIVELSGDPEDAYDIVGEAKADRRGQTQPPTDALGSSDRSADGTVVVMADTRSFLVEGAPRQPSWLPLGKNGERVPYWSLAAALNHHYAEHFNYSFVYFHFNNTDRHSMPHQYGPLKNTWCKVLALRAALELHPQKARFLWLDSDAFVQRKVSLSDFLAKESMQRGDNVLSKASVIAAAEPERECLENGLSKAECRANSGVLILQRIAKRSDGSWLLDKLVEDWWQAPSLAVNNSRMEFFKMNWGFEQGVLSSFVFDKYNTLEKGSTNNVVIVPTYVMNGENAETLVSTNTSTIPHAEYRQTFVRHLWSSPTAWPLRVPLMIERLWIVLVESWWCRLVAAIAKGQAKALIKAAKAEATAEVTAAEVNAAAAVAVAVELNAAAALNTVEVESTRTGVATATVSATVSAGSVAAKFVNISKALFGRGVAAALLPFPLANDAVRSEIGRTLEAALKNCVQEALSDVAAAAAAMTRMISLEDIVVEHFERCEANLSAAVVMREEKRWLVINMLRTILPRVRMVQVKDGVAPVATEEAAARGAASSKAGASAKRKHARGRRLAAVPFRDETTDALLLEMGRPNYPPLWEGQALQYN